MAKKMLGTLMVAFIITATASAQTFDTEHEKLPPLQVVPYVDLELYMGTWYEIASFPQRFQRGCTESQANYELLPNGRVKVVNSCTDVSSGELRQVQGRAWVVDRKTNAKLRVSFFWPFSGKYWIIELGDNYEYAVVGHPRRNYLWILSRTPDMDEDLYQHLVDTLESVHRYDISKLERTR